MPVSRSSPARPARWRAARSVTRSRVLSASPASSSTSSAPSQETQESTRSASSGRRPQDAAWAARISMRQSPYLEWVFSIPPASFTSLPTWPTSSAPRNPS